EGNTMSCHGSHAFGSDAVYAGLAYVRVPDERIEALVQRLETITGPDQVDSILAEFNETQESALEHESTWIDEVFGAETVEEILTGVQAVAAQENEVAQKALKALQRHSPTALKVSLEAVRRAAELSLRSEEHTSELQSRFDPVCRL